MGSRFSFKHLGSPKGQKRDLGEGYVGIFRRRLEAHILEDENLEDNDPIPIWTIVAEISKKDAQPLIVVHDGLGVDLSKAPVKIRERLILLLNDAFEAAEDYEANDEWWVKEGKKSWPPAKETWIDKRPKF